MPQARFSLLRFLPAALLFGCTGRSPAAQPTISELAVAESLYADLRDSRDRIDVTLASGQRGAALPVQAMILRHNRLRSTLANRLAQIDSAQLGGDDRRALVVMQRTLVRDLDSLSPPSTQSIPEGERPPDCAYDARELGTGGGSVDSLRTRLYACYGWAQSHVVVRSDTLDRLTILGMLGRSAESSRRRQLFLALEPVWRSMNGDNSRRSPYRALIAEEMKHQKDRLPSLVQASASGVPSDSLEPWLLRILETWRRTSPDSLIEPWDWYYEMGQASRALSPPITRERLIELNARVYQSFGVDVKELGISYDLEPRAGKTPVAYTTFGQRPRIIHGSWRPAEPW